MTQMRSLSEKRVKKGVISNAEREAPLHGKANGQKLIVCKNCSNTTVCRRRPFSEQAWTVLLLWNEINPHAVDQPICEECYEEMRDVLIDRADEIEAAMEQRETKQLRMKRGMAS